VVLEVGEGESGVWEGKLILEVERKGFDWMVGYER
jgi:hypothetical protein